MDRKRGDVTKEPATLGRYTKCWSKSNYKTVGRLFDCFRNWEIVYWSHFSASPYEVSVCDKMSRIDAEIV